MITSSLSQRKARNVLFKGKENPKIMIKKENDPGPNKTDR